MKSEVSFRIGQPAVILNGLLGSIHSLQNSHKSLLSRMSINSCAFALVSFTLMISLNPVDWYTLDPMAMMDVENVNGELLGQRFGASILHAERPRST